MVPDLAVPGSGRPCPVLGWGQGQAPAVPRPGPVPGGPHLGLATPSRSQQRHRQHGQAGSIGTPEAAIGSNNINSRQQQNGRQAARSPPSPQPPIDSIRHNWQRASSARQHTVSTAVSTALNTATLYTSKYRWRQELMRSSAQIIRLGE